MLLEKWKNIYNEDRLDIADNLNDAKVRGTRYYRNKCTRHGDMVFYTKDNSCPVCCSEARKRRVKINKKFNRSRELLNEIRHRSRSKHLECSLTISEFRKLYDNQVVCPIFGTPLTIGETLHHDNSPSVDRLDPTIGYVVDNLTVISNRANRIKSDGTAAEHIQIAIWMMEKRGLTHSEMQDIFNNLVIERRVK